MEQNAFVAQAVVVVVVAVVEAAPLAQTLARVVLLNKTFYLQYLFLGIIYFSSPNLNNLSSTIDLRLNSFYLVTHKSI